MIKKSSLLLYVLLFSHAAYASDAETKATKSEETQCVLHTHYNNFGKSADIYFVDRPALAVRHKVFYQGPICTAWNIRKDGENDVAIWSDELFRESSLHACKEKISAQDAIKAELISLKSENSVIKVDKDSERGKKMQGLVKILFSIRPRLPSMSGIEKPEPTALTLAAVEQRLTKLFSAPKDNDKEEAGS